MRRLSITAIALSTLLAPPALARTAPASPPWATINVCDSAHHRHMLGVRGQMSGDATHERMYMRFTAQFKSGGSWRTIAGRGTSDWRYAGSALFRAEQTGYNFALAPPAPGADYVLRGTVDFEWRALRRGKPVVVRRAHALTEAGHPAPGADPPRYSAALCRIKGVALHH
ncbi:MAG: hypothetical protein NVSMB25_03560 [Thermoleophilaceae bacterium]